MCWAAATWAETVSDYLDWYEKHHTDRFSHIVLLQPTSPFRSSLQVREAIQQWRQGGHPSLLSVSRVQIEHQIFRKRDQPSLLRAADCDLEDSFLIDGAVYVTPVSLVRDSGRFWDNDSDVYINYYSVPYDIDTEADFADAEALLHGRRKT